MEVFPLDRTWGCGQRNQGGAADSQIDLSILSSVS
ncbi:hypothetical protein SAMN05720354_1195 [Nitrosospira sp. Nsp1]|nr:hypothetical protein SAMN05720354_1195 [Nitrosospira sp. Nsp1]